MTEPQEIWKFIGENNEALSIILTIPGVLFGLISLIISIYSIYVSRKALRSSRPLIRISSREFNESEVSYINPGGKDAEVGLSFKNIGSSTANSIKITVSKKLVARIFFKETRIETEIVGRYLGPGDLLSTQIIFKGKLKSFNSLNEFYSYYYSPTSAYSGGSPNPHGPDKRIEWQLKISYKDALGNSYKTKISLQGIKIKNIKED